MKYSLSFASALCMSSSDDPFTPLRHADLGGLTATERGKEVLRRRAALVEHTKARLDQGWEFRTSKRGAILADHTASEFGHEVARVLDLQLQWMQDRLCFFGAGQQTRPPLDFLAKDEEEMSRLQSHLGFHADQDAVFNLWEAPGSATGGGGGEHSITLGTSVPTQGELVQHLRSAVLEQWLRDRAAGFKRRTWFGSATASPSTRRTGEPDRGEGAHDAAESLAPLSASDRRTGPSSLAG
jgi:hypothetical protein